MISATSTASEAQKWPRNAFQADLSFLITKVESTLAAIAPQQTINRTTISEMVEVDFAV